MARQTHYDILQVSRTADTDTIKRAYRERIRRFHPDQFVAERNKLQQAGDQAGLRKLDRKIERSHQMTQQINAAYDVLMDPLQRRAYDREIAEKTNQAVNRQIRKQRAQHPEYVRRTVKARPHNNPNRPRPNKQNLEETMPRVAVAAFVIIMIFVFGWLSSMLGSVTLEGVAPRATSIGFTANELQATQNSINSTEAAQEGARFRPTATSRPADSTLRSALALYDAGRYANAIELYDRLLAEEETANIFTLRGEAYTALYQQGDASALELALADYAAAIELDSNWANAYRERGLLYYTRWLQNQELAFGTQALADLEQYAALTDDLAFSVGQAINNLSSTLENTD